ncbi:MAG: YunC family protein [Methanomicrobiales archaeon]|nr:YunC family protein [Methanomicrobiales archaeon]NYT21651.1 YunC family protein [Methanomicrobiales archaeon]
MQEQMIPLRNSAGSGYVVPLGQVSLVFVIAAHGMVGCGAFDVQALEKFGYPAARVSPRTGPAIETLDDLLSGSVREVNPSAERYGVETGMSGKDALDLLS